MHQLIVRILDIKKVQADEKLFLKELTLYQIKKSKRFKIITDYYRSVSAYYLINKYTVLLPAARRGGYLTDMTGMIGSMMQAANVSEAQLEAAQEIAVPGSPALSWRYLCYARSHAVAAVSARTHVLWASGDAMIPKSSVDAFVQKASAALTVYPGGEHWFHTDEQVAFMRRWEAAALPDPA